ncbi:C39 family peptidase [Desulfopila inferna]|uniref:C39 family peptidase n=1 Tax=Desulfopila inferna TaxID=468528 RepID=UPI0019664206|nr:C39 family peptidase [Desulfopila inferna]MBM9606743.1 C39 family peptidase [Desulfopila inferna]
MEFADENFSVEPDSVDSVNDSSQEIQEDIALQSTCLEDFEKQTNHQEESIDTVAISPVNVIETLGESDFSLENTGTVDILMTSGYEDRIFGDVHVNDSPQTDVSHSDLPDYRNDANQWHLQENTDTCAVVTQEFILDAVTGHDFSEQELVTHAIEKGYYTPGVGTSCEDVGKILEDYGIEVKRTTGNELSDLEDVIRSGQKVMVGVDCNEINNNSASEQLKDILYMPEANHLFQPIGIDYGSQEVIVNDPGTFDGQAKRVAISNFLAGWADSNFFMAQTTNIPA